jgi:hypothetical protein
MLNYSLFSGIRVYYIWKRIFWGTKETTCRNFIYNPESEITRWLFRFTSACHEKSSKRQKSVISSIGTSKVMYVVVRQDELGTDCFTHRYCTCNKSRFLPAIPSVKTQQKCSSIPGNGTKDKTKYESTEQETYR